MNTQENTAIVRDAFAKLGSGKVEEALNSFHDDAVWQVMGEMPVSGKYVGKSGIVDLMVNEGPKWIDPTSQSADFKTIMGSGDHVAMEWTLRFKTLAGRDYENNYVAVFDLKDGKIQWVREYMDTLYANRVVYDPDSSS